MSKQTPRNVKRLFIDAKGRKEAREGVRNGGREGGRERQKNKKSKVKQS